MIQVDMQRKSKTVGHLPHVNSDDAHEVAVGPAKVAPLQKRSIMTGFWSLYMHIFIFLILNIHIV